MEGLFGQGKSQHGLDRARLRGLPKMHIEGLLTAMVLNIKKLLASIYRLKVAVCRSVSGEFRDISVLVPCVLRFRWQNLYSGWEQDDVLS